MLIKEKTIHVYDLGQIHKGTLIYAKHKSWSEGKCGFVNTATDIELIIQYHPNLANITNHFFLPVEEIIRGEWEVRWSNDLKAVYEYQYVEEGEHTDDTGGIII